MTENQQEQRIAGPTQAEPAAGTGLAAHARLILAVIIAAAFLDVVDFSVVQVALPTIQREFLAPLAESQWVTGVYGLTLAGFLMVSGRAGDVYGQKRIFLVGIVLFTLASLTAGLAPSLLSLVVSYAAGTSVLQAAFQHGSALTAAGIATLVTNAVPIAAGFVTA